MIERLTTEVKRTFWKIKQAAHEIDCSYLSHRWYNKGFERYVGSWVKRDIEILQDGKCWSPMEREADNRYKGIRHNYETNYCPPHYSHDWLDWENQARYFFLRLEIDEALDDSSYIFKK